MGNLSQNKVESSLSGEKVEPTSDQLRLDEIIKLQNRIVELESVLKMRDSRISDLLKENEELLNNGPEGDDSDGTAYTICGEDVYVEVDNIAHQTFFEQLEEKSKKFSINELNAFLEKL